MNFLAGLTEATVEASRVRPGERVESGYPANSLDNVLIRPGGRACYPAVWTQDFAVALATGLITREEMWNHLRLVAEAQNGPKERKLKSGAIVPPFAVPDHVLFNGKAVYYPGTYSSGSDQGGEPWGIVPPTSNQYDFTLIAYRLWQATKRTDFLRRKIHGISVIERLRKAFRVPRIDPATGLVSTDARRRAVGFLFYDSIYMTGHLFFASILRWRTARHLAQLEEALGYSRQACVWREAVASIPRNIQRTFGDPLRMGGWLMAATEVGRQPDVWGTIYALHLGILDRKTAVAARREIVKALEEGTIAYKGAVRHVPTNHDASPTTAWERTPSGHNTYQNGAYWHTPTGWLISVLSKESPRWARRVFKEMIAHLRQEDFRKGTEYCAPWECFGKDGLAQNNPVFLGSVAVPYGVLKTLAKPAKKKGR